MVPDPKKFAAPNTLHVVGFFGQQRPGIPEDYFEETGDKLIEMIPDQKGIVSYNMYRQSNGSFSNLVLLSQLEGNQHWASG